MFSLEAEIHHYIEILEPVLRDAGQEMWQALDRIISAKNAMEGIVAKEDTAIAEERIFYEYAFF